MPRVPSRRYRIGETYQCEECPPGSLFDATYCPAATDARLCLRHWAKAGRWPDANAIDSSLVARRNDSLQGADDRRRGPTAAGGPGHHDLPGPGDVQALPVPVGQERSVVMITPAWQKGADNLFGPYRWRVLSGRGTCFECGGKIDQGFYVERERGQVRWPLHVECHERRMKSDV